MIRRSVLLVLVVLLSTALTSLAADRAQRVFTDPAKAGPDYAIQGEYAGDVQSDMSSASVGIQVVALGDGKFRAVAYVGGLPGAGWERTERIGAEGQLKDGAVKFSSPDGAACGTLKDGAIVVKMGDKTVATLKKVDRKSPTLGQKPPAGAIVLFDGTSGENFTPGKVENGLLTQGNNSKRKFQSLQIHLEFRTPFQPYDRGQGRGNSGFYAQGRYEVQILDSFGLPEADNDCGGIYKVGKPEVNMCLPPLAWQTYDVDFTAAQYKDGKKVANARMTVRHNGVLIHENIEVPHATVAAILKEGPEPGPIHLQDHGNPVRFRNIWVVEKP